MYCFGICKKSDKRKKLNVEHWLTSASVSVETCLRITRCLQALHLVLSNLMSISIETRVEMRAVAMSQPVGWFIPAIV